MPEETSTAASPAIGSSLPISITPVELVLDNYRVIGEIKQPGVPRRLVDLMNNADGEFYVVKDGEIDDPFTLTDIPRRLASMEIDRESVLFAFPRGEEPPHDVFETVRKVPVRSTIILPGFEVTGEVHFFPDVRPEDVPMLENRRFIPMTNARIVASGGRKAMWEEPVVVVNLAQALVFAVDRV